MAASKDERATDLHKSGRVNTKVETQTQVVDHTEASAERRPVEYQPTEIEIGGGTVLVSYGEPMGDAPVAASENEDA